MHEVQTLRRTGLRPSRIRIRWTFGFQRRGLRLCEKLTDIPKPGCLPQMSQTAAIVRRPSCLLMMNGEREHAPSKPARRYHDLRRSGNAPGNAPKVHEPV